VIYLDYNATSPLHPEVRDAMLPYLEEEFGNPSSAHRLGSRARVAVEAARAEVAALIGARPAEIVFTSGGTESNNLALLGMASDPGAAVLTTPIEHSSVREAVTWLGRAGRCVAHLVVDREGRIDLDDLSKQLARRHALVSIGWANNEIGTVQPIADAAVLCRGVGVPLHVDAVQALGKIPVSAASIDLLSVSAHKIGGPKGVGALFVKAGTRLESMQHGGGQERGLRAGTENVAGIVGFGVACRLARRNKMSDGHVAALRERLWTGISASIDGVERNSPSDGCLPNTLNVRVRGARGEALVAALDLNGIAVSTGSACAAGAAEPSHVLQAIGLSVDEARDGLRFSLGPSATADEIDDVINAVTVCIRRMRAVSAREVVYHA
jgi:cysteine desulfurase